jgi:glycosyltransferase involved in cell wall biosynthesis
MLNISRACDERVNARLADIRVAVFTDNDFGKVNGVTTALRALVDNVPPMIAPRIYTCEGQPRHEANYFACAGPGFAIPFYRDMKIYVPSVGRLIAEARREGVNLVHLTTPGPVGLAALHVAKQLHVPLVGSFHTNLVAYTRTLSGSHALGSLMRKYLEWIYGRCERVLVPSEATRVQLIADRIAPKKIALWRRGVCTTRFTPAKRSENLRASWNAADVPVVLYVGRLSKEKGLGLLPVIVRRLSELRTAYRLVLVGDGPAREELQRALPEAVFTGTLTPDQVAVAMASADVFLFPSRTDTAGNVVLEAQASGLPVIVSNAGGPSEQMIDRRTGIVCRDDSTFEFALMSLLRHQSARRSMSSAARRYAMTRQWSVALEPLYQAYTDLCALPTPVTEMDVRPALAG